MFYARLRKLVSSCTGLNQQEEIRAQIIQGCRSNALRKLILRQQGMSLDDILILARSHELSAVRADAMAAVRGQSMAAASSTRMVQVKEEQVDAVQTRPTTPRKQNPAKPSERACGSCGYEHRSNAGCPAKGQSCNRCGKPNHFAKMCRSRRNKPGEQKGRETNVRAVSKCAEEARDQATACGPVFEEDEDEDIFVISFTGGKPGRKRPPPMSDVYVNGTRVSVLIDTGASVNVMDETLYKKLVPAPPLMSTATKIYNYGGREPLPLKGIVEVAVSSGDRSADAKFYVVAGDRGTLLGCHTAEELELVFFARQIYDTQVERLLQEFSQLFVGLGRLKGKRIKLHIDHTVIPVALRHRRVPFHLRPVVEEELRLLEEQGVIEKVDGPTPWVSPLVIAPKPKQPGAIRLCVDMRLPNKAIKRERHITPTMDDIIADLNGAQWFSKLDLNAGYHQLELDPESRNITTFSTHVGLRRYKRLSFGVSSAAEVFQNAIRETLSGLPGVINLSDDILIYSKTREEHHRHLRSMLKRLMEAGLTLHKKKCAFYQNSVEFFGYVFSKDGLQVDPRKAEAIRQAAVPQNPTEVRSFLGMATYCGRFIPQLATMSEPLRRLTKGQHRWDWTPDAQQAFVDIKNALLDKATMAYFNPGRKTEVVVDASPVGLGAVLLQEQRHQEWVPVAYASRALSTVESRYAQIEREALAIRWACRHFHLYLYGHEFQVVTDHKPLVPLFAGSPRLAPPRIERWAVLLQPYRFTVVYRPGVNNPADYLSRHPPPKVFDDHQERDEENTELFVSMVVHVESRQGGSKSEKVEIFPREDQHVQP
ncbi:hypothetical protein NDU88_008048 [Pleurodeles waltl]|uniref:Reverse transcriptase n=1 Tax=Pleurodeles waltl TaxID=8319 RepID=A0AAV7P2I9_PLEWA|nr:hypothetical protein NDU88_008048 [Pleurodeles waltl]